MGVPRPSYFVRFETWSAGALARNNQVEMLASLVSSTVTITPIRTLDLYLVSFDNLVRLETTNLYSSPLLTHLTITMPAQVNSIAANYCYAYFVVSGVSYKMLCSITNSPKVLTVSKAPDFPAFADSFLTGKFVVYTDLIFENGAAGTTTGNFDALTYAGSNGANFQLGTASGTLAISNLASPPIYDTTFNTQSFNKRLCRINDQCMFYLYLKPHASASAGIDRIVFTVPQEFKYQPITALNDCTMRGFTTTAIT